MGRHVTDRREKIEALLHSPIAGEREAAQAALDRVTEERPAYGSTEWHAAVQAWCQKLEFCIGQMGSPLLSNAEVVLIRNWGKSRGDPWAPGAEQIMAVYRKLEAADGAQAVEALTGQVGNMRVG